MVVLALSVFFLRHEEKLILIICGRMQDTNTNTLLPRSPSPPSLLSLSPSPSISPSPLRPLDAPRSSGLNAATEVNEQKQPRQQEEPTDKNHAAKNDDKHNKDD